MSAIHFGHQSLTNIGHHGPISHHYVNNYVLTSAAAIAISGKNSEGQHFLAKSGQFIIRMRGLPYDSSAQQVVEFFSSGKNPCDVMDGEEGILFVRKTDGRPTGDAFVMFETEEMGLKALQKHRELIGSRYIELFRSSIAEVQQVLNRSMELTIPPVQFYANILQRGLDAMSRRFVRAGSRKDCVRLRGLPYEAKVEQILEFLGEHAKNIVFQGVHMVYNSQGQPSGEAFIQMDSEQSANLTATQRHHRYMVSGKKQRYIEVFQCSIDDMNLVLTGGMPLQSAIRTPNGNLLIPPFPSYLNLANGQVLAGAAPPPLAPPPPPATNASAAGFAPATQPSASYYPIIYWPYPSPPVSPTAY